MSGNQSKEHKELAEYAAKINKGEINIVRSNSSKPGAYFPDVLTKDTDIECELFPKQRCIVDKAMKWNPKRKKILYISSFDFVLELFDEIYFVSNDKKQCIKIK